MTFIPGHWICDFCDRAFEQKELVQVPIDSAQLLADVCARCREMHGWTVDQCAHATEQLRSILRAAVARAEIKVKVDDPPDR